MNACKGCGKEIVWGKTAEGTAIPLDPRAPVYDLEENQKTGEMDVAVRNKKAMVSHFATCSDANKFSGSNRRPLSGT